MLLALVASAVIGTFPGHVVLQTGETPVAATLRATALPHGVTELRIRERAKGATIRGYDLNMTKLMHLIVVSDDLRTFRHLHPSLRPDGTFVLDVAPLPPGLYHIYADDDPHDFGRQVFRFDVPIGSSRPAAKRYPHAAGTAERAGPYEVRLDTTTVDAGQIWTLHVRITKDGKPATDLHPYLGAMAHGVFVGVNDLSYMHGHGMSEQMLAMSNTSDCGDAMMASMPPLPPDATIPSTFALQLLAPRPQRYDFWLQFRGGSTLYTVPFLIVAK